MTSLLKRFSPSQLRTRKLARKLARERGDLHANLVQLRLKKGITQAQVAADLDVSQPTIAAFERYDNDPKLSTVHRYALAIGAVVEHRVADADGWLDVTVESSVRMKTAPSTRSAFAKAA